MLLFSPLPFLNYSLLLSFLLLFLLFLSTFLSSFFTIYLFFNCDTFLSHSFQLILFIYHYRGEFIEGTTNRLVTIAGAPDCAQTAHHLITQKLHQVSQYTLQYRCFIFNIFPIIIHNFLSICSVYYINLLIKWIHYCWKQKVLDLADIYNYAIAHTPIVILFLYDLNSYNHYNMIICISISHLT